MLGEKMDKRKKLLCSFMLMVVLVTCFSLFVACGTNEKDEVSSDSGNTTSSIYDVEYTSTDKENSDKNNTDEENTVDVFATTSEEDKSDNISKDNTTGSAQNTTAKAEKETTTSAAKPDYKYAIRVNLYTNCVTVYTKDDNGNFTVPYKAMICSTGRDNRTPAGSYNIIEYYKWCRMVDWTYGQYAYRIKGGIMFHSTPCALNLTLSGGTAYPTYSYGRVEVDEYNKLGTSASLGCIRLTVADAKWICDNCPKGTLTTIVSESTDPLPRPEAIKIPENIPPECGGYVDTLMPENYKASPINWVTKRIYVAWDPTDPNPNNPWNKYSTTITCEELLTIEAGKDEASLKELITVKDTCGNIINEKLIISGELDLSVVGIYQVELSATDALGRKATKVVNINVIESQTESESITTIIQDTTEKDTTEKDTTEKDTTAVETTTTPNAESTTTETETTIEESTTVETETTIEESTTVETETTIEESTTVEIETTIEESTTVEIETTIEENT